MLFDFFDCKQYFTPMKNILFILFLIPAIMISCESFPEAGFEVDTVNPEVGQTVYFSVAPIMHMSMNGILETGLFHMNLILFMFIPEQELLRLL